MLDKYFEQRRFFRQKVKAIFRDWAKEKKDLKERTVKLIEEQVEETSQRLKSELE